MSKPTAAAPAAALHLTIELLPPAEFQNTNQEQWFSIPVLPTHLQRAPNGQLAIGATVSLNNVQTAQFDSSLRPIAFNDKGEQIARIASAVKVPIVLHYEEFAFRITATNLATKKKPWSVIIPYQLPKAEFPRAAMASTWTRTQNEAATADGASVFAKCNISAAQLYTEPFEFTGPEKTVQVNMELSDGRSMTLQLCLQRVQNAVSKEAMSFYVDRVWALRKFAIIADAAMLQV